MHIVQIEHPVTDFAAWKEAFDGDPLGREKSGVRSYRITGPADVLATTAGRQRPDLAVRNARAWFEKLELDVEELPAIRRSDVTSPKNAEHARTGRFFYLVGGDPRLVPKTLADTPLWDAVVQAWRKGAALAGSSAGAMALGEWTLIRDRHP